MKLGVVILAAGQGTRMRSTLPKVLHKLAGKPLLGHVLSVAKTLEPQTIVVVYGHGGDQVLASFPATSIQWVQQSQQLGTGHAVQQALPSLQAVDKVLILYGDVPLITSATLQRLGSIAATTDLSIITTTLENPTGYGRIVRDAKGSIVRIVEQKDATVAELALTEVNTGIMLATRQHLHSWLSRISNNNAQGEFYLTDIIALAVADGVAISNMQPQAIEEIMGVNDRIQLANLERYWQQQQAKILMQAGVTLADPARFDVRGSVKTGIDVNIDINVIIEGEVVLEDGVSIGPHCLLRNCRIGAGSQIYAHSIIDSAIIGTSTKIGPFARLRPGTELATGVHVGNFVELKNTQLGHGSKANHLTYLGDCSVGSQVNVGAGTITCNYDGANKHHTNIGDEAFIGSNTALVAPVTVGAGATIGAGSVITKEAPAQQLTLSRAIQRTLTGWRRPVKKPKD